VVEFRDNFSNVTWNTKFHTACNSLTNISVSVQLLRRRSTNYKKKNNFANSVAPHNIFITGWHTHTHKCLLYVNHSTRKIANNTKKYIRTKFPVGNKYYQPEIK